MENIRYPEHLVFGLDIGTRNIVGTVGYKDNDNRFIVIAQYIKEHETRSMIDGQIHDIPRVAQTISDVKRELEEQVGRKLTNVCIAAAGRVLKTVTVNVECTFETETIIEDEHIHSLELLGVEKAYESIRNDETISGYNFYCVGYTIVRYYMNGYQISNLEGHKATKISAELLGTFLPDDVIDGLYTAVERAGLQVVMLTLEPIAAISVAIPEKFRLLNIALVDVGAGTSDISITKDGTIIAYGMIPSAGDEITERIVQEYLVDFATAEKIKLACIDNENIVYEDIMGLPYETKTQEVVERVSSVVREITNKIAKKIIELNGDKSVSACFVVGGGGKIPGFVSSLAEFLGIQKERVALRGEEVLKEIQFLQDNIKKDSLLVTPIGICLTFYNNSNNFIFVSVNSQRVKLYNNNRLTIMDAAVQIGLSYECLFPKRGDEIVFTLNGNKRVIRGEFGEPAIITQNGRNVAINSPIEQNDIIEIVESTKGEDAYYEVQQLPEYNSIIQFMFNKRLITCPKFVQVANLDEFGNKVVNLVSGFYSIKNNDKITILDYYTLEQVLEFMDIQYTKNIKVNNILADLDEKIYANFSIECDINDNEEEFDMFDKYKDNTDEEQDISNEYEDNDTEEFEILNEYESNIKDEPKNEQNNEDIKIDNTLEQNEDNEIKDIFVIINGEHVKLSNKSKYIFVDILDFYQFDISQAKEKNLVMTLNGVKAQFTDSIETNDIIEIYWKE